MRERLTRDQKVTLKGILIAGLFGLVGNVITSFGPSWLSWFQKPAFLDTEAYKELEKDNARLNDVIQEQLTDVKTYYLSKEVIFEFKKKEEDNIIIEVTTTTVVKNVLDRTQTYNHSVHFLDDTIYESVKVKDNVGEDLVDENSRDLQSIRQSLPTGIVKTNFQCSIKPKGWISIESKYLLAKPLWYQEPWVTNRLMAGPMKIRIRKPTIWEKTLIVGSESLAFEEEYTPKTSTLDSQDGSRSKVEEQLITIPGPLFAGQGIAVTWKWKD